MSSDVSRFSPPTEALALQYEHVENRTWANRSISRVLAEINGNNLTDQATRSRQKSGASGVNLPKPGKPTCGWTHGSGVNRFQWPSETTSTTPSITLMSV